MLIVQASCVKGGEMGRRKEETRTGRLWWDFRYIWMFISTIWVFLLIGGIIATWQQTEFWFPGTDGPVTTSAWSRWAATVLALAFIGIYLEAMYRWYFGRSSWITDGTNKERWAIRLPLLTIATLLVFLPYENRLHNWAGVFQFVVIAWTLTSTPDSAFSAVVISTALSFAILWIAYDGGQAFSIAMVCLAFGFFTSGYVINRGVINELHIERARVRDQAVTEERFRLARDLHDTVGHGMTQITLKSELARRLIVSDPDRAERELADVESLSRTLSAEVRRSIAGETTLSLDDEIARTSELLQSMGIDVTVERLDTDNAPSIADPLAWCLREGVMNTIKHSGATHCTITMTGGINHVALVIADNGSNPIGANPLGQGMRGMEQRVQAMNGTVTLTAHESGHTLTVRIPA